MEKLFIYYSQSGNGDYLAQIFKEKGYITHKVETMKVIKKMGFWGILKYGGQAMMGKRTPIMKIELDLARYSEVIIGSPIWNDRLSTPILSLLDQFEFDKDKTKFLFYSGGGESKHAQKQIEKLGFKAGSITLKQPLKYQEEAKEKLKEI